MWKLETYTNFIRQVKSRNDLTAQYFETWEEAHAALIARLERAEATAAEMLERAKAARRKAQKMKPPTGGS